MRSDKTIISRKRGIVKELATCASALVMCVVSGQAAADDTEIFFKSDVPPNVLFILDRSGSMKNKDGIGVTRMDRLKTALSALIQNRDNFNAGLMQFSGAGVDVLEEISPVAENKSQFLSSLCLLYTSPSPRDGLLTRMPSSA